MNRILLLCLTFLFLLNACAPQGLTPNEVVKEALEATKKFDKKALQKISGSSKDPMEGTPPEYEAIFRSVLGKLEYFVGGSRIQGNTATVKVTVIAIDLEDTIKAALPRITEEALNSPDSGAKTVQIINEIVNKPNIIKRTTELELDLANSNNEWILISSERNKALSKAVFGAAP
jgi:hypothetical protein